MTTSNSYQEYRLTASNTPSNISSIGNIIYIIYVSYRNGQRKNGKHHHWMTVSFILLIVMTFAYEGCSLLVMSIIGLFYKSISSKNESKFLNCIWEAIFVVLLAGIVKCFNMILSEICTLFLRQRIISYIQSVYISNGVDILSKYDNIDQRITQDSDLFSSKSILFIIKLLSVPFILIYYTYILWYLFDWFVPLICYVYFVMGYVLSNIAMKRVIPLNYEHERLEGNFRYHHVHVRDSMESIYLLQGQEVEKHMLNESFDQIFQNQTTIIKAHVVLYTVTNMFSYLASIVSYVAIGIWIFYYEYKPSSESDRAALVASGSYACLYLVSSFSTIIDSFELFSQLSALALRLRQILSIQTNTLHIEFNHSSNNHSNSNYPKMTMIPSIYSNMKAFDGISSSNNSDNDHSNHSNAYTLLDDNDLGHPSVTIPRLEVTIPDRCYVTYKPYLFPSLTTNGSIVLSVKNIDVYSVDRKLLLKSLSFEMIEGMRVLITGPSGCGKSALLKTIAELPTYWTTSIDTQSSTPSSIHFNLYRTEVLFHSQEPYIIKGSLVSNVVYPIECSNIDAIVMKPLDTSNNSANNSTNNNDHPNHTTWVDIGLVKQVLCRVGLNSLYETELFPLGDITLLTNSYDWISILSPGMKQKLAIARVLYHKPSMVFLDEATSSLDETSEQRMYEELMYDCKTIVSVGHRTSLRKYHTHELKMISAHEYTLEPILTSLHPM